MLTCREEKHIDMKAILSRATVHVYMHMSE